jgi:hypothetical protein
MMTALAPASKAAAANAGTRSLCPVVFHFKSKMGQWCFLIHLNDISAILRSVFGEHWRSLLREELRLLRCAR